MTIITITKYLEILLTIYMKNFELKKNWDHWTFSIEKINYFNKNCQMLVVGTIYIFILHLEWESYFELVFSLIEGQTVREGRLRCIHTWR